MRLADLSPVPRAIEDDLVRAMLQRAVDEIDGQ